MGYNMEERSRMLSDISLQKWSCRVEGRLYSKESSRDMPPKLNMCKNQPKLMIKYINLQTALCTKCQSNNITVRCNKEHLEKFHGCSIDDVREIVNKMTELMKSQRSKKPKKQREKDSDEKKRSNGIC